MGLLVYLFDTRDLLPENKNEVYEYINRNAFFSDDIVVNNKFAGFAAYYERDPSSYLTQIPHKCPYKDVTGWDLENMNRAFLAAFKNQP